MRPDEEYAPGMLKLEVYGAGLPAAVLHEIKTVRQMTIPRPNQRHMPDCCLWA